MSSRCPLSGGRASRPLTDGGSRADLEGTGVVLVVDDNEEFAETIEIWLSPEWEVLIATDGDEAIDRYSPRVDVVLLDRRMPTVSGDEALQTIRDRDGNCCVAMMTAVGPTLDVTDMEFDMYLQKPVTSDDVLDAVETLSQRARYSQQLRALFSLSTKLAMLQDRYRDEQLEESDRYQRLQSEFDRVYDRASDELGDVESETFSGVLQTIHDS